MSKIIDDRGVSLERIHDFEAKSKGLEPTDSLRLAWQEQTIDFTENQMRRLPYAEAYKADSSKMEEKIGDIQEESVSIEKALEIFDKSVTSSGTNQNSASNFGFIPGSSLYPSVLADFLASSINIQPALNLCSPGAVKIENDLIKWMCKDVVGFDGDKCGGVLTSGGSMANLYAVSTSRDAAKIKGKDLDKSVIYCTSEIHYCFIKALKTAGMSECIIRRIDIDDNYKMIPQILAKAIEEDKEKGLKPFLVIATAGTTGTGTVDPLEAIGNIAQKEQIWFHIDAAYGGFFALTDEAKDVLKGLSLADSVTLDPHKSFFVPFGTGAFLVKDVQHLFEMYSADNVRYMPHGKQDSIDPNMLSPEMSRNFRGLRVWLPLKIFGLSPIRACLSEKILLCRYFHQEMNSMDDFEVGPFPDLSIALFRFAPKEINGHNLCLTELNKQFMESINQDGLIYLTPVEVKGKFWLRLAVLNFKTHLNEVQQAIKIIRVKAEQLLKRSMQSCKPVSKRVHFNYDEVD